jgi:hypothetical protein
MSGPDLGRVGPAPRAPRVDAVFRGAVHEWRYRRGGRRVRRFDLDLREPKESSADFLVGYGHRQEYMGTHRFVGGALGPVIVYSRAIDSMSDSMADVRANPVFELPSPVDEFVTIRGQGAELLTHLGKACRVDLDRVRSESGRRSRSESSVDELLIRAAAMDVQWAVASLVALQEAEQRELLVWLAVAYGTLSEEIMPTIQVFLEASGWEVVAETLRIWRSPALVPAMFTDGFLEIMPKRRWLR